MNKFLKTALVLAAALTLAACQRVPAGNVGVKVFLLGGAKGVDTELLGTGRYWIGWNEELYLFPTYTQTHTWDAAPPVDNSISFQTDQGLSVTADIGISYHVEPDKVASLFQKYRRGIDEITDTYLRNMVRDALVTAASTREIETVYGAGKAELINEVENRVKAQVGPLGIALEKLYWVGQLRLPPTVVASIDAKIKATQFAQQRENEVAAAKAEADKAVAEARGVADSNLLKAKANAEGLLVRAEAEAKAIKIKGDALRENPRLVELSAIEKWDGDLPQFVGGSGAVPFVNIPTGK